ncbi:3'-5' exonuclease [Saccharicrinis fermentans]|uniref:Putative 3'-5' exonuclease related to the exonuclease domain of PolB n=1 Tax=Saccharicrinis fermentans DSM 9555 = JCM 21142 TaxID=869213 RepID=W7YGN2_9BACT|nr:3'-5' exonuclease [Saccharicrinis fermentans]GAF01769.1 putative 3'-5' exonuclease related to the exonuclease domain of PolB [Saccharicrinis fermentans DSM 9555 = JCM 21142]
MLDRLQPENILFIDIETVPQHPVYNEVEENIQKLWDKKAAFFLKDDQTPADVYQRAGIYAEFGKIVCISAGVIHYVKGEMHFKVKSFANDDEKKLLMEFADMLDHFMSKSPDRNLCGHNAKEFDFPYIARRMLINGIKLPQALNIAGKKPWEIKFIDTLDLWKFGDYKHYTSLNLLTTIFGIPSPKDDIDGSQVADVYYRENDLDRIAIYCEKDVLATAQLLLRFMGKPLIEQDYFERVI